MREAGRKGDEGVMGQQVKFQFGTKKIFWKETVVMAAQQMTVLNANELHT